MVDCDLFTNFYIIFLLFVFVDEPLQSASRVVFAVGGDYGGGVHRIRPERSPP